MHFPKLKDLDTSDLVAIADEHTVVSFERMLGHHTGATSQDGYFTLLTGIPHPFRNVALGLRLSDAAEKVNSFTNALGNAPGLWFVGPTAQPRNLASILLERGWVGPDPMPAMVLELESLTERAWPEGIELRLAQDEEERALWHRNLALGFGMPELDETAWAPTPTSGFQCYNAVLEGVPVGTTALSLHAGVAGIYSVTTLPEYRKKGVGGALTVLPLLLAREQGYQLGTLQASSMGYPLYRRLGFTDVCNIDLYFLNC